MVSGHKDGYHPTGGFPCAAWPRSRADVPPVVACTDVPADAQGDEGRDTGV